MPHLRCPVLLIHGERDDTIPSDDARRLQAAARHAPTQLLCLPTPPPPDGQAGRWRCHLPTAALAVILLDTTTYPPTARVFTTSPARRGRACWCCCRRGKGESIPVLPGKETWAEIWTVFATARTAARALR